MGSAYDMLEVYSGKRILVEISSAESIAQLHFPLSAPMLLYPAA